MTGGAPLPFGPALRQPDQRSCGAAVVVVARMLDDAAYAERALPRFGAEVLAAHRRLTGARDATGALQAPWPRAVGTPPWAVARALPRGPHGVRRARGRFEDLLRAVGHGPAALYVGDRWLPRHVLLAVGRDGDGPAARLGVYDPGSGTVRTLTRDAYADGALPLGRWRRPWFAVLPTRSAQASAASAA
ncbi:MULTISPECIES: hypothetical protein [unclassified Nocardioides]|uniref:hypothetical protein n=2 Tax=Nocardioides TaxID=1839 RepID=UPI0007031ACE|nr:MULTISPECIES: hypothetical protein [unclassified Nocardioides]KQP64334.1 hypothetical protein ASF47_10100 [Nocardioides sp. Leaf285]KQQ43367.1 hypothetical protein ASF50_05275 [Nocardioides sp. Leaf307]